MSLPTTEIFHTLDKAHLINELQCGQSVNQAISHNRRADFSLLLAMFSNDARESAASDVLPVCEQNEETLRKHFNLCGPAAINIKSGNLCPRCEDCESIPSWWFTVEAKLQHYLVPDALTYQPEHTHSLEERVYHNLSGHQRRWLENELPTQQFTFDLYNQLITNHRQSQIQVQI
ncbi:VC2046/SO_2500 family protein [Vibrio sp. PP-XX7]